MLRAGTAIGVRPSRAATPAWTAGPWAPIEAKVPAAPPRSTTNVRDSVPRRRSMVRLISSIQMATL